MSDWKTIHQPCPANCGSSDAYCEDHSGEGFCFSCRKYFKADGAVEDETAPQSSLPNHQQDMIVGGIHRAITERAISKKTCEFFDVKVTDEYFVFPHKNAEGELCAQKLRNVKEKRFSWRGDTKAAMLFGSDKFKGGNTITIVGGEFDALAFRDLSGDYPVVSTKNGENSIKDIKANLEYFSNFNKVYICLDNDATGREYAPKLAELFPIGKAKIVTLRHAKDPNEYLQKGLINEFKKCWWAAVDYTPAGIEAANEGGFDSLFEEVDGLELFPYPYDKLNESTFGIRKSEMVTVVAGSGVGKSAFIREVAFKLLMETDKKVGMLMLEESPKKTKLGLMGLFLNKPLHLTLLGRVAEKFNFLGKVLDRLFKNKEDYAWDEGNKKELLRAWNSVVEKKAHDGEQQLWLFSHFGSNDINTVVNRIDAMVTGLGCEFIFLDHISIVVSDQQNSDERKALDELATKLRTLVERRNFALIIVSHLRRPGGKPHEEGGETSLADIRGTAGIGQLSDIVIGLERNGQADDEMLRNITKVRVLKNRFAGFTGLTSYAQYETETGRLIEVDRKAIDELENKGSTNEFLPETPFDDKPIFDNSNTGRLINEREK